MTIEEVKDELTGMMASAASKKQKEACRIAVRTVEAIPRIRDELSEQAREGYDGDEYQDGVTVGLGLALRIMDSHLPKEARE